MNPTNLYIITLVIGIFIVFLSINKLTLGFSIWIAIYPLISGIVAPEGLEKFPVTRIINIILFFVLLFKIKINNIKYKLYYPEKWYILFIILALFSAILSKIPGETILRSITYFEPFIWFLIGIIIVQFSSWEKNIKIVLKGMICGFIFVCLYALVEFITQTNFLIDNGLINKGNYINEIRFGISGRLSATIGQPVYTSIYILILLTVSYFYLIQIVKFNIIKITLLIFFIIGLFIMVFTGTRAGYVGLAIFPLLYFLLNKNYKSKNILALYLIMAPILLYFLPNDFWIFLKESFTLNSHSTANANFIFRIMLSNRLLDIFLTSPLMGVGPGFIQKQTFIFNNYEYSSLAGQENQYATLLAENGILGLFAFLMFVIAIYKELSKNTKVKNYLWFYNYKIIVLSIFLDVVIISISCSIITLIPMYYLMALIGISIGVERKLIL